ncbi:TonB-dependent receptor [Sphingosinicella rhizophila]|uniref:TonB-dependent receptor n=1 Tax=Sphingosinicella rhizophila TaxID=3050082 RepID=A0ABU3QAC9_9SPHN|nr:TonB-dependent receptor [Sphingosinicella sp. GR2756]MDT9600354.1 TonB-dependent receptor [Sphingosinicella sp. GR2756]
MKRAKLKAESSLKILTLLAVLGAAGPAFAQDAALPADSVVGTDPATELAGNEGDSGDIIVTARRREESLMDVPVSISAVTAEEIELRGAKTLEDLARSVPGLVVARGSEQGDKNFAIRGISSASTVAVYLDDTPITFGENSPDLKLFDIAQVEVLRGPQGTLFGASSMGGAIRYASPRAHFTAFEGMGRVEGSLLRYGGTSYEGQGVVTGPLVHDRLALRLSGFYRHDAGYNDLRDETNGEIVRRNIDTVDSFGGRAALSARIGERVEGTLSVIYQDEDHDGLPTFFSGRGVTDTIALPPRSRVGRADNFRKDRTVLPNLTLSADLGFARLTSSSSYVNRKLAVGADFSYFVQAALGIPDPFPLSVQSREFREFSGYVQELRLASSSTGPLQWLLGGFYRKTSEHRPQSVPSNLGVLIPALEPALLPGGSLFEREVDTRRRQLAGFGELSYTIADVLTITAGVRFTELKQRIDREADGLFNGGFSEVHLASKESPITPKFSVQYSPSDQVMVYATAAKGFREGGPNAPVPLSLPACVSALAALGLTDAPATYGTDSLWSYELGTKLQTSDRKFRVVGAVYHIDWSKIQESINLSGGCGFGFTDNIGSARSRGFELEATWRPVNGLSIDVALGHNNAKLTQDLITGANASGPIIAAPKGTRLSDTPDWTAFVAGHYTFPLSGSWKGFARAELQYVGDARRHLNTPSDDPRNLFQQSYELVNLRFGVTSGETEIQFFVNNLFNDDTLLYQSYQNFAPGTAYEGIQVRPRVIGISAKRLF